MFYIRCGQWRELGKVESKSCSGALVQIEKEVDLVVSQCSEGNPLPAKLKNLLASEDRK